MFRNLILERGARFYNSKFGKLFLFLFSVFSIIIFLSYVNALSLSCSFSTTCKYPSFPVVYVQNDTGGYENAHAQNTSAVSLEGLLGWYRFDNMSFAGENDSIIFDWSGMGNNGTAISGAFPNSSGKLKGAYSFDGTDDYVQSNSQINTSNGQFTLTGWYYSTSSSAVYRGMISKRAVCGDAEFQLHLNNDATRNLSWWSQGSALISSYSFPTNTWVFVSAVFNESGNGRLLLYTNNTLVANFSLPSRAFSNTQTRIGTDGTCGNDWAGLIDEVMIFNRTLSAQEIMNLYNKTHYTYNSALCCTSETVLNNRCVQSTPLRLSNYTNAHVQLGSQSTYNTPACFASQQGRVQCTYTTSSCSSGYVCIGSIASSEVGDSNLTNSHIGSCNAYTQKICCRVNTPSEIQNLVLNSTFGTNLTSENLTVYFNQSDLDADFVTNITDWRINGQSFAILNMPFNTEETSTTSLAIRDYSTYGNNGTISGSVSWVQGIVGGAYRFYHTGASINIGGVPAFTSNKTTVVIWYKNDGSDGDARIVNRNWCTSGGWLMHRGYGFGVADSGGCAGQRWASFGTINQGEWYFLGGVFNGTHVIAYKNGVSVATTTAYSADITSNTANIALMTSNNGTIDELLIFNRSLSAEQIYELYLAGLAGRSLQKIHFNETDKGQNWTCLVTPNDGIDGVGVLSNQVIINNTLPTVTLSTPSVNNVTTNRTPQFTWVGYDPDGDSLTYEINITAFSKGGTSTCVDVRLASASSASYIPSGDLLCLSDNRMVYNWSVRANDGSGWGSWSDSRLLNISAYLAVSLPTNSVEFGSLTILQSNDTTDDAPLPFRIQNDGNALTNINLSSSGLWASVASPNRYYQYKIANVTGEEGAFNWSGSLTTFTNFSTTQISSINRLNYTDVKDIARVDVRIEVPSDEPPAYRNTTVTFMAMLGEY